MKHIFILMLLSYLISIQCFADSKMIYLCDVEKIHNEDSLGILWKNAKLRYDLAAGTLDGSFDPNGELAKENITLPFQTIFSRLKMKTAPSKENNLHSIQYDKVGYNGNVRPIVAWLTIETLNEKISPNFIFFSTTIETTLEGKCTLSYK